MKNLEENESIFHSSPHQYYENRALKCRNDVSYEDFEMKKGYWENLTLAEFWSSYDIVYGKNKNGKDGKLMYILLENKKGFIKLRYERCVLKYYLNYTNEEDLARGLLILFHPFTNEMKQIHEENVSDMYFQNREQIEEKRNLFEKHKIITDIVQSINNQKEDIEYDETVEDDFVESETTTKKN